MIISTSYIHELEFEFSQEDDQINIKSGWWNLKITYFPVSTGIIEEYATEK
jgi:hypothetical protein